MSFLDSNIGTPIRSSDMADILKPLLDRISALEAQAQGDAREWEELTALVKSQGLRIAGLEGTVQQLRDRQAVPPIMRDLRGD